MKTMLDEKTPNAILDYYFGWDAWLNGDTISSYVTTVTGDNQDMNIDSHAQQGNDIVVILSGGTHLRNYEINCAIITASGLSDNRTMLVKVRDR